MQLTGTFWTQKETVAAAESAVVELVHGGPSSIAVASEPTGTAIVSYTLDDPSDNDAKWFQLGTNLAGASNCFSPGRPARGFKVAAAVAGCDVTVLQPERV
ncbi:hypothetical protein [Stagnimonas aquatica]|uniref:hypothetical protein n=1 Tax=Stagnimonas aquatica TaxID=2689987 RepID=UPI001315152D|nr:hypothetical protein [Stagnimonas aquatica]